MEASASLIQIPCEHLDSARLIAGVLPGITNGHRNFNRLSLWLPLALVAPALDLLNIETPIAADLEARQLPCFE
jgi:hypothetical protein